MQEVLKCFIDRQDDVYQYRLLGEQHSAVIKKTYILDSQRWPVTNDSGINSTIWQHRLTIFIPPEVTINKALLYVGGGYNTNNQGKAEFSIPKETLDFSQIAITNKAPIILLEDVPNQYLLINSIARKEDQILAYSYKKVMEDPLHNAYLAGHLPMAKSIVKAMDAAIEILKEDKLNIESFMLVGLSKRGWAVWLASLSDERVSAIIPGIIDILNVQENINHICNSYKNHCPPALKDYAAEGIIERINSQAFTKLMDIEDPLSYMNMSEYRKQASIPKYIINTSGDDFYTPDSSRFYFQNLKGTNYIRYLPKAMHYLAGNPISDYLNNMELLNQAVSNYFYFHIHNTILPQIKWKLSRDKIDIDSDLKPEKAILWTAYNDDERDFRYINSHSKYHLGMKILLIKLAELLHTNLDVCDTCFKEQNIEFDCADNNHCHIEAHLPMPEKGWQASFVELFYNVDGREFIITTEVNVSPDTYY